MNFERVTQLINHIIDHPEQWNQTQWHCGTTHCFAGHAQIMAGKELDSFMCKIDAQTWLELTSNEADWSFSANRTLPELHRFVLMSVQGIEFDEDGFNRYGFNKNGYDEYGHDEYGQDECGYDKSGFNIYGYDKYGYDEYGFNVYGYDIHGYDVHGFNKDGFNKDGFNKYGNKLARITITEKTNEQ